MIPADEALERLVAGNRRFVSESQERAVIGQRRRSELVGNQEPFAVVLGCSDSRVPAELVFGCGLGDLFVIRVAGNIVAPSLVGSVEFAAGSLGTQLVVVLGHTGCGAIKATLRELEQPDEVNLPNLRSIIDRIRPALEPLVKTELRHDPEALERGAVRANIRASVEQLRSPLLDQLIADGQLVVVAAEYDLESGRVDFFDPEGARRAHRS